MRDGRNALLIRCPADMSPTRDFGFQVPGEADIRWRAAEAVADAGGGALFEV